MITFFVPGVPQPQGSKTAYARGGRAVVVDKNPKLLKPWRRAVTGAAELVFGVGGDPMAGPVRVSVVFVLPRGKSVQRESPCVRPDLDKLVRALFDGVTDAGVWGDDSQVTRLVASKVYGGAPGALVSISEEMKGQVA